MTDREILNSVIKLNKKIENLEDELYSSENREQNAKIELSQKVRFLEEIIELIDNGEGQLNELLIKRIYESIKNNLGNNSM